MAKVRRGRARRLILDIGTSAVRLCELTQSKAGFQLTKYYHREFGIDPSMDDDAQRQVRQEVLKTLLKDAKVRHNKVVFGVPGQSVFTRTRALPPVPEYKVTQIVRYEIQQQIPFSLDQIAFDYQVLKRTEAGGYDVLMAAIKVDVVDKRLEIIKDIKKRIDIVDVCPLAAYNWLKSTGEFGEQGECVALIDLGAATTDIVIERDNLFRFTRSLNIGGNDITSAVAAEFGVSFIEAEKMKRDRGFAPTGDLQRDGKGGEVIGRVLSRLVSEITRSFAYFRSQPGGGAVSRIVVTGGGACLRNMIPFLQRMLGVEVRIAQPLAGLAIGPAAQEVNEHPEQAAVALGLALRCCQSVPIAINLIPPRILDAHRHREQLFYWALSVATLGLIMASIIPAMAQKNKAVREEMSLLERQIIQYDPRFTGYPGDPSLWTSQFVTAIKQKQMDIGQIEAKVNRLDTAYAFRPQWIDYMVAINEARPKGKTIVLWSCESTNLTAPMGPEGGGRRPGIGGGIGEADGASNTELVSSPGFRGISSGRSSGGSGEMGLGGRDDRRARGAGPGTMQATDDPGTYNGVAIRGFAGDTESLFQFVEALKASGKFVKVYFDDRFVDPVSVLTMDNATGGTSTAATPSMTSSGDDDDDDRRSRGRNRSPGGFGNRPLGGSTGGIQAGWNQAGTVLTFRIDLQTSGEPVQEAQPGQEPAMSLPPPTIGLPGGAPPTPGSPAFRGPLGNNSDEEEE
ncbi:MAG: type IV pilus assembly protein PilM [Candidatus Hydrogenedentales bacterium]|jgi:type IV pilus assembly protein PilM